MVVSFVHSPRRGRMTSVHHQWFRCAAVAVAALAGCSRIGDGANGSADAAGLPAADAAPDPSDAAPPDAGSGLVETVAVPADGSAIATASVSASGVTYRLEASGVFKWGNCDASACPGGGACGYERLGDAYYRSDDCWASTTTGFSYISLYVDGQQVDWGGYDPDHVYSIQVAGTGAPFQLEVMDCESCYLDNTGELQVELYRLPTTH